MTNLGSLCKTKYFIGLPPVLCTKPYFYAFSATSAFFVFQNVLMLSYYISTDKKLNLFINGQVIFNLKGA